MLDNAKLLMDDGMRARVRVPVSDPYKALLINERAIGTDQGIKFVYVVNADHVVERRDIQPARSFDGMLAIKSGLKPAEWIIVNGIQRVRGGNQGRSQAGAHAGGGGRTGRSTNTSNN